MQWFGVLLLILTCAASAGAAPTGLDVGFEQPSCAEGGIYPNRSVVWARVDPSALPGVARIRAIVCQSGQRSIASSVPAMPDKRVPVVDVSGLTGRVTIIVQAVDESGEVIGEWQGVREPAPPYPARLALSFPIRFFVNDDHCYYMVKVGDLDNDGRPDYLITRGTVNQEAHDADGRLLWEYDDPKADFKDVGADSDVRIYDIDNDGANEAILARRVDGIVCLCIVDGKTGEIKRRIPYPGIDKRKDRSSINIANLTGKSRPSEILVSWDYTYIGAFDARLNLLWESSECLGHTPKAADVNGDGKDEVLCSTTLLDSDGKLLWSRPDLPKVRSLLTGAFEYHCADSPHIAEIDGNRSDGPEIFFSTGGWLLNSHGKALWGAEQRVIFGHHADIGKVFAGRQGTAIALLDWRDRGMADGQRVVSLLDCHGRTLWTKPSEWMIMGDWTGDGLNEVFLENGTIVSGDGRVLGEIPAFFANAVVCDLLGDMRDEIALVSVSEQNKTARLEVHTNAKENRCPATSRKPERRSISTRTLNWTSY